MRRAQSYPCPFCSVTSEKRATAQAHLKRVHFTKAALVKPPKGITFVADVAFDVGRHDFTGNANKAVNAEDGAYRVTLAAVK